MVWLWNNLEIMFANHLSDTTYDNSLQNSLPPPWQNQHHLTNRCKKQQQCKTQQQPCNLMVQNSCPAITPNQSKKHPKSMQHRSTIIQFGPTNEKNDFMKNERLAYTKHSFSWFQDMLLESKVRVQINLCCVSYCFCFAIRFSSLLSIVASKIIS